MDFTINANPSKRYIPSDKASVQYKFWAFVNSAGFEYFILLLITLNTVILMMKVSMNLMNLKFIRKLLILSQFKWHNQSEKVKNVLKLLNIAFTSMFTLESILKLAGYGLKVKLY